MAGSSGHARWCVCDALSRGEAALHQLAVVTRADPAGNVDLGRHARPQGARPPWSRVPCPSRANADPGRPGHCGHHRCRLFSQCRLCVCHLPTRASRDPTCLRLGSTSQMDRVELGIRHRPGLGVLHRGRPTLGIALVRLEPRDRRRNFDVHLRPDSLPSGGCHGNPFASGQTDRCGHRRCGRCRGLLATLFSWTRCASHARIAHLPGIGRIPFVGGRRAPDRSNKLDQGNQDERQAGRLSGAGR